MAIAQTSADRSHQSGLTGSPPLVWWAAFGLVAALFLIILLVYRDTTMSLVDVWSSSNLYGHGILVLPAAIFLLWLRRGDLSRLRPQPSVLGLVLLSLSSFVWLAGETTSINLLRHLGLVSMLPGLFVSILGLRIARVSALPLGLLLFAVPFGGEFIPVLQEFTGIAVASMLVMTGVPAFLDANYLAIPSGRFEIAEACAGARFLIASVAIAAFGSDILYSRLWKRLAFAALAIAVAVVGNAIRAYLIVAIADWRGLEAGIEFDHVTFGMVFLSFILVLLFSLGMLFRDSNGVTLPIGHSPTGDQSDRAGWHIRTGFFSIAAMMAVSVPYLAAQWTEPRPADATVLLAPFKAEGAWRTAAQGNSTWRPDIGNADAELLQDFVSPHGRIRLHVSYFSHQRQGAELVQEGNASFAAPPWRIVARSELPLRISQNTVRVPCATIEGGGPQRRACHIFWVNGTFTGSALTAKLYQAIGRLSFQSPAAAILSFSWESPSVPGDETKQVENLFQSLPPMAIWLRNVVSQP